MRMQLKHPAHPLLRVSPAEKVMTSLIKDSLGVVIVDYLEDGHTTTVHIDESWLEVFCS